MRKTIVISAWSALVIVAFAGWSVVDKKKPDLPNVLVVIIDDLGFHDLSGNGSKIYETPNVDKLANQSRSFGNAYANYPRCLPSRFAMITGSYPVAEFNGDLSSTAKGDNFIRQFKRAGYESFYVGKWHQKGEDNSPIGFGFDASYGANTAGGVASHFYPYNTKKLTGPLGDIPPIKDVENDGRQGDYLADVLTDKMIDYVKQHGKSKPFFGVLSTYAVHSPFEAKQEDIDRNEKQIGSFDFGDTPEYINEGHGKRKMRQDNAIYAAMVENMDWNVGRLLDALKEAGIDKNTIVVFTSDHGGLSNNGLSGMRVATTNLPLKAGKGHLYEGGVRIPLLVRWPEKIKPAVDSESIVSLMDLMPTLLDLATNAELKNVEGRSFRKVLTGKEKWDKRTIFFLERMARPQNTGDAPAAAVRSANYKLINFLETNTYELYDLSTDIGETVNLAEKLPDVTNRLRAELNAWMNSHQPK